MLGTFLTEPIRLLAETVLIISALSSSFVAWRVWQHSKRKDAILEAEKLAKQKDLDKTNQDIMDTNQCVEKKASKMYVDDKLKVVHKRINDTNERGKENFDLLLCEIRESRDDIKTIMGAMKIP